MKTTKKIFLLTALLSMAIALPAQADDGEGIQATPEAEFMPSAVEAPDAVGPSSSGFPVDNSMALVPYRYSYPFLNKYSQAETREALGRPEQPRGPTNTEKQRISARLEDLRKERNSQLFNEIDSAPKGFAKFRQNLSKSWAEKFKTKLFNYTFQSIKYQTKNGEDSPYVVLSNLLNKHLHLPELPEEQLKNVDTLRKLVIQLSAVLHPDKSGLSAEEAVIKGSKEEVIRNLEKAASRYNSPKNENDLIEAHYELLKATDQALKKTSNILDKEADPKFLKSIKMRADLAQANDAFDKIKETYEKVKEQSTWGYLFKTFAKDVALDFGKDLAGNVGHRAGHALAAKLLFSKSIGALPQTARLLLENSENLKAVGLSKSALMFPAMLDILTSRGCHDLDEKDLTGEKRQNIKNQFQKLNLEFLKVYLPTKNIDPQVFMEQLNRREFKTANEFFIGLEKKLQNQHGISFETYQKTLGKFLQTDAGTLLLDSILPKRGALTKAKLALTHFAGPLCGMLAKWGVAMAPDLYKNLHEGSSVGVAIRNSAESSISVFKAYNLVKWYLNTDKNAAHTELGTVGKLRLTLAVLNGVMELLSLVHPVSQEVNMYGETVEVGNDAHNMWKALDVRTDAMRKLAKPVEFIDNLRVGVACVDHLADGDVHPYFKLSAAWGLKNSVDAASGMTTGMKPFSWMWSKFCKALMGENEEETINWDELGI